MNWFYRFKCWLGFHYWVRSWDHGGKCCLRCGRVHWEPQEKNTGTEPTMGDARITPEGAVPEGNKQNG